VSELDRRRQVNTKEGGGGRACGLQANEASRAARKATMRQAVIVGAARTPIGKFMGGTELEFVIMVIAVSCVKLLSAHNSTQHTSRKHKV
jgi:Thiolase, N-terminal domain.